VKQAGSITKKKKNSGRPIKRSPELVDAVEDIVEY
jgi:hypothetical protein